MPYVKAEIDRRKKGVDVKSEWLKLRVSKAELEAIRKRSKELGVSVSELIRMKALER